MIKLPFLKDKSVGIVGCGITGIATIKACLASGANVYAWDDSKAKRDHAESIGTKLLHPDSFDLNQLDYLLWSPGIKHHGPNAHPIAKRAKDSNLPLYSDIDFLRLAKPNCKLICITGTNGKSTTTSLIGHIIKEAGANVQIGGNLGTAALELEDLPDDGIYVLELSSYQLDLSKQLNSDVSILLNISPDHLDYHGSMDEYAKAKAKIFQMKDQTSTAIIGVDDEWSQSIYQNLNEKNICTHIHQISITDPFKSDVMITHGWLHFNDSLKQVINLNNLLYLPGSHNWQNISFAIKACEAINIDTLDIIKGIMTFSGLEHRQKIIFQEDNIKYVNDSKATNIDAASRALACYQNIYWIAGGRAKHPGLDGIEPYLSNIVHVFLVGESANDFATWLDKKLKYTICETIDRPVEKARRMAACHNSPKAVSTILLSPAAASFDQFPNFEARGDFYKDAVQRLVSA